MKCPACGAAKLVHDTRDMPYTYKGESTTIPAASGDFCPSCDEVVLNAAESARLSAAMLDFNKQVNAAIVDPAFIVNVRKKLALDQREAAEIFDPRLRDDMRAETFALFDFILRKGRPAEELPVVPLDPHRFASVRPAAGNGTVKHPGMAPQQRTLLAFSQPY